MKTARFWILCGVVFGLTCSAETPPPNGSIKPASWTPHVGDETSVAILFSDPHKYLNKTIVVCGGAGVDNYYSAAYEGGSGTYYSLKFTELTEDMRPTGQLRVYALRTKAEPLVGEILKSQRAGFPGKVVRLKVMVTDRSFWNNEFQKTLELTDWQFFKPEQGKWGEWAQQPAGITQSVSESGVANDSHQQDEKIKALIQRVEELEAKQLHADGKEPPAKATSLVRTGGVNTLNGSYSTGPIYPPERSNLYRTVVIHDPPYTCSLDFSDDGTVFAACKGHIYNRGTYQIIDRKIRFVWVDTNQQPAEAEMQGDVIFWRNGRYERK